MIYYITIGYTVLIYTVEMSMEHLPFSIYPAEVNIPFKREILLPHIRLLFIAQLPTF